MTLRSALFVLPCCLLVPAAGCGRSSPARRVWGTVTYQGRPVEEGQIVFFPIEGTTGPSTGAAIEQGRYDVPARTGPYAGGVYRVEITALGPERTYSPNVSGEPPLITVRDPLIPPAFNRDSTLRVTIADRTGDNQHDFDLE